MDHRYKKHALKLSLLSCMIFIALLPPVAQAVGEEEGNAPKITEFDTDFLKNTPGSTIDISRFERGLPLPPGEYRTDIYINNSLISRENIEI